MAKIKSEDLLDAFKEMTLIELSDFVKQFEDTFEVTAAAPVAAAVAQATSARTLNALALFQTCLRNRPRPDPHRAPGRIDEAVAHMGDVGLRRDARHVPVLAERQRPK